MLVLEWIQGNLAVLVAGGLVILGPTLYALNRFLSSRRKSSDKSQGLSPTLGGSE